MSKLNSTETINAVLFLETIQITAIATQARSTQNIIREKTQHQAILQQNKHTKNKSFFYQNRKHDQKNLNVYQQPSSHKSRRNGV